MFLVGNLHFYKGDNSGFLYTTQWANNVEITWIDVLTLNQRCLNIVRLLGSTILNRA